MTQAFLGPATLSTHHKPVAKVGSTLGGGGCHYLLEPVNGHRNGSWTCRLSVDGLQGVSQWDSVLCTHPSSNSWRGATGGQSPQLLPVPGLPLGHPGGNVPALRAPRRGQRSLGAELLCSLIL